MGSLILGWKQLQQPIPTSPSLEPTASVEAIDSEAIAKDFEARGVRPVELRIFGAASDAGIVRIAVYTSQIPSTSPIKQQTLIIGKLKTESAAVHGSCRSRSLNVRLRLTMMRMRTVNWI